MNFTYSKYLHVLQHLGQYCSTRGFAPRCCNTTPRAAIHARILNTWNSNYKYPYITFILLLQKNERIFWFFFSSFVQFTSIFFNFTYFLKFHVFFFNFTYFFAISSISKYMKSRICILGQLHQKCSFSQFFIFSPKNHFMMELFKFNTWTEFHM